MAAIVDRIDEVPLPERTLLDVDVPAGACGASRWPSSGQPVYRDAAGTCWTTEGSRRRYHMYGAAARPPLDDGTDLAAVAAGRIAVTPLHFDLTDEPGIETLGHCALTRLLGPAADEID